MPTIRIYEPALCCDTGVCGADVDQSLVTVTADVRSLKELGADIERHNLASDPIAFTNDETVRAFMHTVGSKGLPLTVVDGVTVAVGAYPSRDTLIDLAGIGAAPAQGADRADLGLTAKSDLGVTEKSDASCCGSTGCC